MVDRPLRASHASPTQTSAEQDMKAAFSYIEDAERPFFDRSHKLTLDDTPLLFELLDNAARQLAAARTKNPDQKLNIEDPKEGPLTFTIDELAGAISYREGHVALVVWRTAFNEENRKYAVQRARGAFQKAVQFCPTRTQYYLELAQVCLLQDDRRSASEAAASALKLNPDDPEAIKLNSEIAQLPEPSKEKGGGVSPLLITGLIGGGLFIGGMIIAPLAGKSVPDGLPPILGLLGFLLMGGSIALAIMLRKPYNEYRKARSTEETNEIIAEMHERRYQAERERRFR